MGKASRHVQRKEVIQQDGLPAVGSRCDWNQAAHDGGATVLLDPIGGHQVDPAAEEIFQAISQVDEADSDGLGEARQQVRLISQGKRLLAVGSSVAKEP